MRKLVFYGAKAKITKYKVHCLEISLRGFCDFCVLLSGPDGRVYECRKLSLHAPHPHTQTQIAKCHRLSSQLVGHLLNTGIEKYNDNAPNRHTQVLIAVTQA